MWDVLNEVIKNFPPFAAVSLLSVAGIIFIIGFSRHGINFLKYGFKQTIMSDLLEKLATKEDIKRIDTKIEAMETKIEAMGTKIGAIETTIEAIEVNHFGHLKKYLTVLNGILLDKKVIDHESKARLDNELQGM
jgi:hypothetical protein